MGFLTSVLPSSSDPAPAPTIEVPTPATLVVSPQVSVVNMSKPRADRRTLASAITCASFVLTFLQAVMPQLQSAYPGVHWLPALSSGIGALGTAWLTFQRNTDANTLQSANSVTPGDGQIGD